MPIERIHGTGNSKKDIEKAKEYIDTRSERFLRSRKQEEVFGENEWQGEIRAVATELISRELRSLHISHVARISPDQFIFTDQQEIRAHSPENAWGAAAVYDSWTGIMFINRDAPRHRQFKQALHEAIHASSFHDWVLNAEQKTLGNRRLGMGQQRRADSPLFLGTSEATTERLRWKLTGKYRDEIRGRLHFGDEEMHDLLANVSYVSYIRLLDAVNDRIAERLSTTRDRCWDAWTKAMFTGEMMGVRQVEHSWGEGSLRVLSRLGYDKQIDAKVFKFFNAKSESVRERIRRELLDV